MLWLALLQGPAMAQTLAGTHISTQASATYRMDDMVHPVTAWSPVVVVNVLVVESLTLTGPTSVTTPPGGTVLVSYLLTNKGNAVSRYRFQLASTGCSGTNQVLGQLRLALDADHNGVAQAHETVSTGSVAASLSPGQSVSLLVQGLAPSVPSGLACVTLTATTDLQEEEAVLSTAVQVGAGASVSVSKTVASSGTLLRGTGLLDFTVTATNIGTDAAGPTDVAGAPAVALTIDGVPNTSRVLLRDALPAGTQYVMGTLRSDQVGA